MHTSCAGLTSVPEGDWLCESCLEVLEARKKCITADCPKDIEGKRSLEAQLPSLPALDATTLRFTEQAHRRFKEEMTSRKAAALARLEDNQNVLAKTSKERIANLTNDAQAQTVTVEREKRNYNSAKSRIFARHGLTGWSIQNHGRSHIKFRRENGTIGETYRVKSYTGYGVYRVVDQCTEWNK